MTKIEIINSMYKSKVMAIVRVDIIERAFEIAEGCLNGGVNMLEISYTSPKAGVIIEALKNKYEERLLIGAGTVLDSETGRDAILRGADYIIAPNFDEELAKLANRYQIPYLPGCTSYTEAIKSLEYGASFIKAFPISNYYGVELIKTFKTPVPNMPIMASGGITLDNIGEWKKSGAEILGIGSLLTNGSISEIEKNARKIISVINE